MAKSTSSPGAGQPSPSSKSKPGPDLDTAAEPVTAAQRARIARSAEVYLQRRADLADCNVRFDVMILAGGLIPRRIVDAWRP